MFVRRLRSRAAAPCRAGRHVYQQRGGGDTVEVLSPFSWFVHSWRELRTARALLGTLDHTLSDVIFVPEHANDDDDSDLNQSWILCIQIKLIC